MKYLINFYKNLSKEKVVIKKNMAKKHQQFKIIIEQGSDGYFTASAPALPGCYTQAKTLPELKKRIKEAILLCLEIAETDSQYRRRLKNFAYEPNFIGLEMAEV